MTCSFSFDHYRELLGAAADGAYRFAFFDEEPSPGTIFLRHDVDLSLDAAVRMAEVEVEEAAFATYFLMTQSVFYNLASPEGLRAVNRLRELGHRVGLHAVWPGAELDHRFDPVVAWHNPEPEYMTEPLDAAINVMQTPWFDPGHYRSDSNQRWLHGCPHAQLAAGEFEWLQLLIHPEIWVYPGDSMRETMESMLEAERRRRFELLADDRVDLS
ncbi:MAG: hypothetical protein M3310_05385 [Actinomycetota bacterium]|nr:hypothetical protein [Actinomycetota bacterium]